MKIYIVLFVWNRRAIPTYRVLSHSLIQLPHKLMTGNPLPIYTYNCVIPRYNVAYSIMVFLALQAILIKHCHDNNVSGNFLFTCHHTFVFFIIDVDDGHFMMTEMFV